MGLLTALLALLEIDHLREHHRPQRRNPRPARRNPADAAELERAWQVAEERYGDKAKVVELDESERHLPRYGVVVGNVEAVSYEAPGDHSTIWDHEAGDRGPFLPKAQGKMVIAVDPDTRRPFLIKNRSRMKLTDRGLEG